MRAPGRPCDRPSPSVASDIAIALHPPPHRSVSLALVAQAVGAKKRDALTNAARQLRKIKSVKWASKENEVEVVA